VLAMRQLAFLEAGRVAWQQAPEPECPDPGGALVRPLAVARCDLDQPMAAFGFFPGPFPVGHETVAEVIAVGDEVSARRVGERVLVPFQVSCGTCVACRERRGRLDRALRGRVRPHPGLGARALRRQRRTTLRSGRRAGRRRRAQTRSLAAAL
jgi:threonine dehydrogenase-like Zn-dependent dehydrogenase